MTASFPRSRASLSVLGLALLLAAGCGGGDKQMDATPDDVDASSSATVTEEDLAAFAAPADSMLSADQVTKFLKVSLLQFDLVRKEGARIRDRMAKMDERAKSGGLIAGLRNAAEGVSTFTQGADVIGGSYVRAARTLGYNPAEMEWIGERMSEVGAHLTSKSLLDAQLQAARQMREQAEQMRAQGMSATDVEQMKKSADEMIAQAQANAAAGAAGRNLAVLRRARPAVTEPMWSGISLFGGTGAITALAAIGSDNTPEQQKKLDDYRGLFQAALENRVAPGMEEKKPAAPDAPSEAAPATN